MDCKAIYQRYVAERLARLKARIFKRYAVEEIQEYCQEAAKLRMDNGSSHEKTKGFLLGTVLTWAVTIPCTIGIFAIFTEFRRAASEQQAAGLVWVAITPGAKVYATFGLLGLLLPMVAMFLLIRSFSSGHRIRTLVSTSVGMQLLWV
jgi:hypothetical protein